MQLQLLPLCLLCLAYPQFQVPGTEVCHVGRGEAQAVEQITAGQRDEASTEEGSQRAPHVHVQRAHIAHQGHQEEQRHQSQENAPFSGLHLAKVLQ